LMAASHLTQGGFYSHFASKEGTGRRAMSILFTDRDSLRGSR
jgi:hypothetical protein